MKVIEKPKEKVAKKKKFLKTKKKKKNWKEIKL